MGNLNPVMLKRTFSLSLVLKSYYLLHPVRYCLCNSLIAEDRGGGGETSSEGVEVKLIDLFKRTFQNISNSCS